MANIQGQYLRSRSLDSLVAGEELKQRPLEILFGVVFAKIMAASRAREDLRTKRALQQYPGLVSVSFSK